MTERSASIADQQRFLAARDFLMQRVHARAAQEGTFLTPEELKYLDDRLLADKAEGRRLTRKFQGDRHMEFSEKIEGLLHRAAAAEIAINPEIRRSYIGAVEALESSEDDFMLWACAVPALAQFDDRTGHKLPGWVAYVLAFSILLFVAYLWFRGVR